MKKLTLCLALLLVFSLVSCDLSHKHYTDEYGYCSSCKTDTAVLLQKDDTGGYASETCTFGQYATPYFKFTASGEAGIKIEVIPDTAEVSAVILYTRERPYVASKYDRADPTLLYEVPLEAGDEYFVRLELSRPGTLSIRIAPQ